MHSLKPAVEVTGPDTTKTLDGIEFTSCAFVTLEIDDVDLFSDPNFESTVVFFQS
jgi:hypothetical protein